MPVEYGFVLTGEMPVLFHADDIEASDTLKLWRDDTKNKEFSVRGDDRSPPWTWQTYLYNDGKNLVIPQANIMTCLRKAGAMISTGKGTKTFKDLSQSGMMIPTEFCEFRSRGKMVSMESIVAMVDKPFSEHIRIAKTLGFELMVKRAKVGASKHIRVRAKFDSWTVHGSVIVIEPAITAQVLTSMFDLAGRLVGLLDWRPSSPKSPGPYGKFRSEVKAITARKSA